MNIQESIKILKELKKNEWGELENCYAYGSEAIETLLTAYEKEKEKNKKAKEFIKENSHEFNCKRDDLIELEFDDNTNATDLIDILEGNY